MTQQQAQQTDRHPAPAPYPDLAIGMYSRSIFHDQAYALRVLGLPTIVGLAAWYAIISMI